MKPQQWYIADPGRLVLEVGRVERLGRTFVLHQTRSSSLYWTGEVRDIPHGLSAPPLRIAIFYREAYPAIPPNVHILEPEIDPSEWGHEWHRWEDGTICIFRPSRWNMGTTADEIIEKIADWYFNYTAKKASLIDQMPDFGRAIIPSTRLTGTT